MPGHIFVISAPSGAGKTTIIKKLLKDVQNIYMAVSCTTRAVRPQEEDGRDYHFVSRQEFDSLIKDRKFVEWAEVHGQKYGTLKSDVDGHIQKGVDVLLDIDTQGAEKVKKRYPDAVLIFLLPPSFDELERRLRDRGVNTEKDMETRINNARDEYSRRHEYNYQVVNETVEEAVQEVREIVEYYRENG